MQCILGILAIFSTTFIQNAAAASTCKSVGATSWSTGNECSMQVDLIQPIGDIKVDNTSDLLWTIRSAYGDPIVLGKATASSCDTSKSSCLTDSNDFVSVPSTFELINSTFARGKAVVSFPNSGSYQISVVVVAGGSGQQFMNAITVAIILPSTTIAPATTTPIPSTTMPPNVTAISTPDPDIPATNTTPAPPNPSRGASTSASLFLIIGLVIALIFGAIFGVIFCKLRKARANISSQSTNASIRVSRVEIEMDEAPARVSAPEPFSRRVYVASTFNSNDESFRGGHSYVSERRRPPVTEGYVQMEDTRRSSINSSTRHGHPNERNMTSHRRSS